MITKFPSNKINVDSKAKKKLGHTSQNKIGSGDNYGTGVRNKIGRPIDIMGISGKPRNDKKPPKSLA